MSNSKRLPARTPGTLPLLLACAFLACGLVLFGVVSFHSTKITKVSVSQSASVGGAGSGSGISISSRGSSSAAEPTAAAAVELQALLKSMQDQIKQLQTTLPETIQNELKSHHKETQQQQQQQQQQQREPPKPPEQQAEQSRERRQPPPQGVWLPEDKVHHIGRARSACDKTGGAGIKLQVTDKLVAPVVVVAHNRVHYLAKCLMTLLKYWSEDPENAERFPLFVSVDGGDQATMQFAAALNFGAQVQVIHNLRDSSRCKPGEGYCNLSVHYHMLVQLFFECNKAPRLLFMEEDLEIAPDFFSYFSAFAPVLDHDKGLMCVSAWNDHGQRGRALDPTAIYRTDIFPGLGWMLTREMGMELLEKWPNAYWDEYLREPKVRKGRQCIYPEVPRTHTFGKVGTSGGQFFDQHLAIMLLNKEEIDWAKKDLSVYESGPYTKQMADWLAAAQPLEGSKVDLRAFCDVGQPDHDERGDLVLRYRDGNDWKALAAKLHPMQPDLKGHPPQAGSPYLPRGSSKGVAMVRCRGRRLFLAPKPGSPAEPADWPPGSDSPSNSSSTSSSTSTSTSSSTSSSSRREDGPGARP